MSTPNGNHDYVGDKPSPKPVRKGPSPLYKILQTMASLRVTVVLFSLAMVLVFFGTLSMVHESIEETVKHYFRSWYVFIELRAISDFGKVFFPTFFGPESRIPGKLPFPGGYIIGWAMFFNLLAAHAIRFKLSWKRSGIFLLHAGVIVLLAGEFFTGQLAVETRMIIKEGESSQFAFHLNEFELAIVDGSNPDHDDVVVVPGEMILDAGKKEWISNSDVPFDIQLVEAYPNARLKSIEPGEQGTANKGVGLHEAIDPQPKVKGTDSTGEVNYPAMYLSLRDKQGNSMGTFLFSSMLELLQNIKVGEKTYKVSYRFKRTYKPYVVHVDKTEHDVYAGTDLAKDYASTVRIEDPELGEHGPIRIWMNHPMYYRGETFYQSSMPTDESTGVTSTGFQIVRNPTWRFPYLACGMVGLGLAFHFLVRLVTFLKPVVRKNVVIRQRTWLEKLFPVGVVGICAAIVLTSISTPSVSDKRMNVYGFGQIPVQQGGRIQPLDSVARNSLVVISGKQEFTDPNDPDKTYSATEWLLNVWAKPEKARKFHVFRVDHPQILALLGLPQRPGSYRYSLAELEPGLGKLERQSSVAAAKPKDDRDSYDLKIFELAKHVEVFKALEMRKNPGMLPANSANGKWTSYGDKFMEMWPAELDAVEPAVRQELAEELHKKPDLMIDLVRKQFGDLDLDDLARQSGGDREKFLRRVLQLEVQYRSRLRAFEALTLEIPKSDPALGAFQGIIAAYAADDPAAFNAAVGTYRDNYTSKVSDAEKSRVALEARMNYADLFLLCEVFCIFMAILAALSWLVWSDPLRRSAFWLGCLTLGVHTAALFGPNVYWQSTTSDEPVFLGSIYWLGRPGPLPLPGTCVPTGSR